ncbi:AI-2E family transporter [Corynebacterium sphenisci]|uniref:AI-2E family transporter n=1 Tax=Corynebacterium sphenisci TaxID=191493 RepID=UPI0026DEB17E|nr:AI-2E family transporter [Corynebacterium sphenisci]MDO5731437.1 AI-2E family transporter [Corynebacterium sphenisci]
MSDNDNTPETTAGDTAERDIVDQIAGANRLSVEETLAVPGDDQTPAVHAPADDEAIDDLLDESAAETIDRADVIGEGARWFAAWCLRFLIVAAALYVGWRGLSKVWGGLLPVLLALIVSTVLWPVAATLRKAKLPASLAAIVALLGSIAVVGGVFALMAPVIRSQLPSLVQQFDAGIRHMQDTLMKPPFNINGEQVSEALDQATNWMQEQSGQIAGTVVQGVSAVSSVAITLAVTLVLTFFFIKDGDRFLPWIRRITGRRLGWHLTEVLSRSWNTLSGFIRTQALVSLIDAVFIGGGLWLLNVPLALVLAVITFFAGFIPIVGAISAGFIAVVVALVANGLSTAIFALLLILAVQQIEGNILSPMLQSKAMDLHAAIVLLAVTVGGGIFGIIGAFLAVPVAAVLAVWFRYLGDLTDLRTGVKTAKDIQFATEAGSISGMQTEAMGRLMRDRLLHHHGDPAGEDGEEPRPPADTADTVARAQGIEEPETRGSSFTRLTKIVRPPFRRR